MLTKESILKYLKSIKPKLQKDGIEKIGLFGSFAKDQADLYSDIDIAIQTSEKFTKKFRGIKAFLYLEDLKKSINQKLHRKIDICDESGLKDKLKEVIYV